MPLPDTIHPVLVDTYVGLLLPLLLPSTDGDKQAAQTLALDLLAEFQPRSGMELMRACEAVAFKLTEVRLQIEALVPGTSPERQEKALKSARTLARSGRDAHRLLLQVQSKRLAEHAVRSKTGPRD